LVAGSNPARGAKIHLTVIIITLYVTEFH
jgi:hypothetical protein